MSGGSSSMVSFTKVILPSLLASFVPAYAFWDLARNRKVFGGTVAPSYADPEWENETNRKMDSGWPREGGPPVVLNPISRQNYKIVE